MTESRASLVARQRDFEATDKEENEKHGLGKDSIR